MATYVLPGPLRLSPAFPFAGRSRELATLGALFPRAAEEGRRAALVSGEPGSGKSRLARELAVQLTQEGAIVLFGAADAVITTPYGPFVEALAGLVHETDPQVLRSLAGAGELTRLLPDLESTVGPLPARVTADADTERHRLHTAVTDLLTTVSEQAPVLMVLEDVHWADPPTIQLVRHLTRFGAAARMLLVVTFRDVEAEMTAELAGTVADAARLEGVTRLRLAGLDGGEVAEFVRLATGAEPGPELIDAIGRLTDGNAFLLTELWRELVETDTVDVGAQSVTLRRPVDDAATPETVREVVTQRIGRLDSVTVDVLELGAVVGASFELDTIRRAAGVSEAKLLDAIDETVRNGLLLESPGLGLGYRFAHELVRRAVVDRVSAARRADLHLRVARALEQAPTTTGEATGGRLAALAFHYAEAAPLGDRDVAVAYNLRAAEAAAAALAFDDAVGRLRTALDLGVPDARLRAEAALALGAASHRAGRALDALDAFRTAAAIARELGDVEVLARAAIGFEEASWRPAILDQGAVALLEEAVEAIGPEPTALRVRLLAALTRALDFLGNHELARPVRDDATALARSLGDPMTLGLLLASGFWSRGARSDDEINAMLTESLAIGEAIGDVEICAEALSWLVPSYVALCDNGAARATLSRLFDLAGRTNEPFRLHVAEHYSAALALCDGDLAGAEAAALRSNDLARLLTGRDASGVHGIQMFGIRREQGRLAELAPVVRVLAGQPRSSAWAPGLVVVLADLGMEDEARRELGRIRAGALDAETYVLWLATLTYLTDACSRLSDTETAAIVYPALHPYRGTNIQVGHLVACYGAADRYLGMLATVLGDYDLAEEHFEDALALNTALGAQTWLAHTQLELARMLLLRRAGDDRARAAALLGQAAATANDLGLAAVLHGVSSLGAGVEPSRALPDGLTAREVEILTLVAGGLSNREVGERLVISEHTAANHIRSILRKTGCANRTEAATYAHRRGLLTS